MKEILRSTFRELRKEILKESKVQRQLNIPHAIIVDPIGLAEWLCLLWNDEVQMLAYKRRRIWQALEWQLWKFTLSPWIPYSICWEDHHYRSVCNMDCIGKSSRKWMDKDVDLIIRKECSGYGYEEECSFMGDRYHKSEDVLRETSLNTGSSLYPEDAFLIAGEESRLSIDVEETEKHLEVFQTLKESFLKAYKVMDRELRRYTNINCFCSGTTAVPLVKQSKNLAIGNIEDSRAVLATRGEDDSLTAVQLTVDLKPNLPESDIDQFKAYYQASGGEKKRRVFGLGSKAKGYYEQTFCVSCGKTSSSASHELCLAFAIFGIVDDVGCFKDSWLMFGTMDVLDIIMYLDVAMFGIIFSSAYLLIWHHGMNVDLVVGSHTLMTHVLIMVDPTFDEIVGAQNYAPNNVKPGFHTKLVGTSLDMLEQSKCSQDHLGRNWAASILAEPTLDMLQQSRHRPAADRTQTEAGTLPGCDRWTCFSRPSAGQPHFGCRRA
ncbi:putative protein phosphatase 2C 33 [Capsicum chinense]|nr:putative protein phosphatase 2C 33 [Capsicum chinense]